MIPLLVFDIETVPDLRAIRPLWGFAPELTDHEACELAFRRRRLATGSDFLPHHLQQVVAISCLLRDRSGLKVWSLGEPGEPESVLVQRFFDGIDKYTPQLVSWNGSGFDLPVLHYRALLGGVQARRYWDQGDDDREFRWNNYLGRYHSRHLDLMNLLASFQGRATAPLNEVAQMLGFPGKLGMDGSEVWSANLDGGIERIRNYCETDVVNTYLIYLAFERLRGHLDPARLEEEKALLRSHLQHPGAPHWQEFLAAWAESPRGN